MNDYIDRKLLTTHLTRFCKAGLISKECKSLLFRMIEIKACNSLYSDRISKDWIENKLMAFTVAEIISIYVYNHLYKFVEEN